jgi:predicted Rossmann fold flavoprotein
MRFFEDRGVKLKVERQLRVFPESDKSDTILKALSDELKKNKVWIIHKNPVKDILIEENKVKGVLLKNGEVIPADRIILATGGVSFSFTGSSGEGIEIARKSGHRVMPLRAGLVPLETKEKYVKLLEGLTLKNIRLKFSSAKKEIFSDIGELLFTSFGISGPLVLSLSGKITDWLEENKSAYVDIDLKPALTLEQLDNRLLREFKLNSAKSIKSILRNLLPQRLADIFADILKIDPDKKVSQITQAERKSISSLLKNFRLDISRAKPVEEGMVTRGGVSLKDVNPRTMESHIIKGLYFAGEIMDIDADTGGFNLQAAFSTGYLAGESASI